MMPTDAQKNSLRLGEILVMNGWITWEQLEQALEIQRKTHHPLHTDLAESGSISARQSRVLHLGEILIQHGMITWDQLTEALRIQRETGRLVGAILVEKGYLRIKDLHRALAIQHNKTFADFQKINVSQSALKLVPKELAREYRIMPLVSQNHTLLVAVSDPNDVRPEAALHQELPHYDIHTAIACPEEIKKAFRLYYGE